MKDVIELPGEHELAQGFYIEPGRAGLKPNCVFMWNGKIAFETNALGLCGPEPDPQKRLAVIWGDSVIFGLTGCLAALNDNIEEYQFMNGGIEGDCLDNILARAARMNDKIDIDLNIIFPGWHPSWQHGCKNEMIESWLDETLSRQLKNSTLVTLPTALTPEIVNTDLRPYINLAVQGGSDGYFNVWGNCDPSPENVREIYNRLIERNQIIRKVATRHCIMLFDWFEAMRPSSLDEARHLFFDVLHPRQSAAPVISRLWLDWLQIVLVDAALTAPARQSISP